jgi:hypothetical protein
MSFPRILARAPEKRKVFDTTCRLYHMPGATHVKSRRVDQHTLLATCYKRR